MAGGCVLEDEIRARDVLVVLNARVQTVDVMHIGLLFALVLAFCVFSTDLYCYPITLEEHNNRAEEKSTVETIS